MVLVVIREKEARDAGRIADIVRGLPEWFTSNAVSAIVKDCERLPGFVVEVDSVVRGFILLEERECCVEIAWLAVERGFHGRGLGSMLVAAAEKHACRAGKPVLTVKTYGGGDYEPYRRTMRFYRRNGFKLYEIIDNYQPYNGQPAAVLIKLAKCISTPIQTTGSEGRHLKATAP